MEQRWSTALIALALLNFSCAQNFFTFSNAGNRFTIGQNLQSAANNNLFPQLNQIVPNIQKFVQVQPQSDMSVNYNFNGPVIRKTYQIGPSGSMTLVSSQQTNGNQRTNFLTSSQSFVQKPVVIKKTYNWSNKFSFNNPQSNNQPSNVRPASDMNNIQKATVTKKLNKPTNQKSYGLDDNSIPGSQPTKTVTPGKGVSKNTNYCEISKDHTMCRFPTPGRSKACKGTGYFSLTKADEKEIVQRHNELRASLSTGFANQPIANPPLPPLKWNPNLAAVAQRWADQCNFNHDTNRNIGPDKYNPKHTVGQNLAYTSKYNLHEYDIKDLMNGWIDEAKLMTDPRAIKNFDLAPSGSGHYTQMVWRNTREVGCGAVVYEQFYEGWMLNRTQLVCNYYPAGNYQGQPIY